MPVQHVNSQQLERLIAEGKTLLLDFYADWCGPCRMLTPVLEEIAEGHPELVVCKINVDEEGELAQRFGIVSIPFVTLLRGKETVATSLGYRTKNDLLVALGLL